MGGLVPNERKRAQDAAAKRAARAQGVIPSDVRLSYEKTIGVLAAYFEELGMLPEVALERAERVLCRALPARLRPEMVPVSGEERALLEAP
jgi:hypothetical protein